MRVRVHVRSGLKRVHSTPKSNALKVPLKQGLEFKWLSERRGRRRVRESTCLLAREGGSGASGLG